MKKYVIPLVTKAVKSVMKKYAIAPVTKAAKPVMKEISDSDEHKACKAGHEACSCKCTSDSDKDNTISNLDMNDIEPVGNALFVEKNEENLSNIVTYASLSSVVLAASCSHQFNGSYTVTKNQRVQRPVQK